MNISRRNFLVGCSTAIAAMAGSRLGPMAFAQEGGTLANTDEILVVVFLRGGMDGLSLVAPFDDSNYRSARGSLALPTSGENGALAITPQNSTMTSSMGLHAKASPLRELYQANELAFVHACGLNDDTRSHFDAMDYMERGTPGNKNTTSGWLTRHLEAVNTPDDLIPVLSAATSTPDSLLSYPEAVAMQSPKSFDISTHWRYNQSEDSAMLRALETFYPGTGTNLLDVAGKRTLDSIAAIQANEVGDYVPSPGAAYPDGSFGDSLKAVAQMIKLDLGLHVATVDLGGWDTHENQGSNGEGYFAGRIDEMARGLHAFYDDMGDYKSRLTIVVMSEFGRRLGTNASSGTDHGHGNVMTVIGGNVNGGKIYGDWPGLAFENLDQRQDLKITTDYRTVLGEIVTRRLGNPKLGMVFPGLTAEQYQPLGILQGSVPGPIDFSSGLRSTRQNVTQGENRLFLPMLSNC